MHVSGLLKTQAMPPWLEALNLPELQFPEFAIVHSTPCSTYLCYEEASLGKTAPTWLKDPCLDSPVPVSTPSDAGTLVLVWEEGQSLAK